jgi:DNA-directed RNA polymerase specialized sigma24 family protein
LRRRSEPENAEVRAWFNRIATRTATDAERLASTFRSIGAHRVR